MTIGPHTIRRHAFIQGMMAKGCLPEDDAKGIFKDLSKGQAATDEDFYAFLAEVNNHLEYLHMEIRAVTNLCDSKRWVAFLNKITDNASASQVTWPSSFTPAQLLFFRSLVDHLATEEPSDADGLSHISSTDAVNMGLSSAAMSQSTSSTQATVRKMTIQEKQDTLKRLKAEHWLDHHPALASHYCIGVRTFAEMRNYLLSMDLPEETRKAIEHHM